ncbi:MAG: hypothetical protein WC326_09980 [Candidatus Delongbacteria bacterium]
MPHLVRRLSALALLLTALTFSTSCIEHEDDPACDFRGLAYTDSSGTVLFTATGDQDWCVDTLQTPLRDAQLPPGSNGLAPAWPNPVEADSVHILFSLAQTGQVHLCLIATTCDTVVTLVDGLVEQGAHEVIWSLKDEFGVRVPAGIYRCAWSCPELDCAGDILIP